MGDGVASGRAGQILGVLGRGTDQRVERALVRRDLRRDLGDGIKLLVESAAADVGADKAVRYRREVADL